MVGIRHALRCGAVALLLSALALVTQARAETGVLRVEVAKAGFIFGVGGGSGTLLFRGRSYPLSVGGVSFGATIGASKSDLVGHAYNLHQPSDIAGTYSAVGGGLAVAGGRSSVRLQNAKGVVIELRGRKVGFEFSANISGVDVQLR